MAKIQRDYGFFVMPDSLVDFPLSAEAKLVYVVLARHADKGGECFPSGDRLGKLAGISRRQVIRATKELEAAGWLDHKRTGRSNLYTLRTVVTTDVTDSHNRCDRVAQEGQPNEGQPNEGLPAAPAVEDLGHVIMQGLEQMNGAPFGNYPKEWKATHRLVEKIHTVCRNGDQRQFLRFLVKAYLAKKASSRGEFWREAPLTPTGLDVRFDQAYEYLRKRASDWQDGQQNRELLERLMKK